MEVLIVDVRSVRTTLNSMVVKAGAEDVVEAAGGREAVMQVIRKVPDLVFLAIRLPDMSGLEVLAEVRKSHP